MAQAVIVPTDEAWRWWDQSAPHLARSVKLCNGRHSEATIREMVMSGEGMLWICWDGTHVTAAAVTQLVTYPTGKVFMSVPFLGGSGLNEFIDSLAINIIDVAKHNGASGVEIPGGRAGWLRPLAKYGMKRTKLQWMEKEINEFD